MLFWRSWTNGFFFGGGEVVVSNFPLTETSSSQTAPSWRDCNLQFKWWIAIWPRLRFEKSRAAKRGGFPIWTCASLFVFFFLPFFCFWDVPGLFFLRFVWGFSNLSFFSVLAYYHCVAKGGRQKGVGKKVRDKGYHKRDQKREEAKKNKWVAYPLLPALLCGTLILPGWHKSTFVWRSCFMCCCPVLLSMQLVSEHYFSLELFRSMSTFVWRVSCFNDVSICPALPSLVVICQCHLLSTCPFFGASIFQLVHFFFFISTCPFFGLYFFNLSFYFFDSFWDFLTSSVPETQVCGTLGGLWNVSGTPKVKPSEC